MRECTICPRRCGADRLHGKTGVCGVPADIYAGRAALHYWEEPCISGSEERGTLNGSGAVFFSGCALKCVYCQNYDLSHKASGRKISAERLAEIFLELQDKKANNINLVTPTQYAPQIAEAAFIARSRGLAIPFVFNCGGYEDPSSLAMLDGVADIYLTDFKYISGAAAKKYSGAEDYPEKAKEALREMTRQQPECVFSDDGLMKKGVIVRHLVLPGMVRNAEGVIDYVYDTYKDNVWLSIMNQYTPFGCVKKFYPELDRKVTKREYDRVIKHAIDKGIVNAFIQEGATQKESFIPSFDGEGI